MRLLLRILDVQVVDLSNILAPPVLTLIGLLFCYLWSKSVRRGQPLTAFQKALLWYAAFFMLGMSYTIVFHDELGAALHWKQAWIVIVATWGIFLAFVARWQYHRKKS